MFKNHLLKYDHHYRYYFVYQIHRSWSQAVGPAAEEEDIEDRILLRKVDATVEGRHSAQILLKRSPNRKHSRNIM
jgi:hypothetical protein